MFKEKTLVSLDYQLHKKNDDGSFEIIEQTSEGKPLTFIIGDGMMLPTFEEQIMQLNIGDTYAFEIPYADAFGERIEENITVLPNNIFEVNGKFDSERVFVGATVPLNTADGRIIRALILSISDEEVKVDINHPLAGVDVKFTGKILDAIELTEEQYQKLHEGHCGCHCGGGSSDGCGCGDCGGCGEGDCHCGNDCGCDN